MTAKEFRIGNLVQSGKGIYAVAFLSLDGIEGLLTKDEKFVCVDNIIYHPIPLTEGWLLRFGFELVYQSVSRRNYELPLIPEIGFDYMPTNNMNGQFRHYGRHLDSYLCKYVHQLQNLYFALTGKELIAETENGWQSDGRDADTQIREVRGD